MSTNVFTYGTITGSSYALQIDAGKGDKAPDTPAGLIVTRAVQTRDGWLAQILVDKQIAFEEGGHEDGEDAIQAANAHVVSRFRWLIGSDTSTAPFSAA